MTSLGHPPLAPYPPIFILQSSWCPSFWSIANYCFFPAAFDKDLAAYWRKRPLTPIFFSIPELDVATPASQFQWENHQIPAILGSLGCQSGVLGSFPPSHPPMVLWAPQRMPALLLWTKGPCLAWVLWRSCLGATPAFSPRLHPSSSPEQPAECLHLSLLCGVLDLGLLVRMVWSG